MRVVRRVNMNEDQRIRKLHQKIKTLQDQRIRKLRNCRKLVSYVVETGLMTMDAPDDESFKNLIGSRFRIRGVAVRVAYKFDNGWQTGKWQSVSES